MSDVPLQNAPTVIDLTGSDCELVDCEVVDLTRSVISPTASFAPSVGQILRCYAPRFAACDDELVSAEDAMITAERFWRLKKQIGFGTQIRFDSSACRVQLGPLSSAVRSFALPMCLVCLTHQDRVLLSKKLKSSVQDILRAFGAQWSRLIQKGVCDFMGANPSAFISGRYVEIVREWPFAFFQTGVVFLVFAALCEQNGGVDDTDAKCLAMRVVDFIQEHNAVLDFALELDEDPREFGHEDSFVTFILPNLHDLIFTIYVPAWEEMYQ